MGGHLTQETAGGYTWTAWITVDGQRITEHGFDTDAWRAHHAAAAALEKLEIATKFRLLARM